MQNTMLDSTISSNSQELFDFNATHNGEACIESLRPEDRGTERQFWFTIAMMCVIFDVAERTLRDNIESLIDDGEVDCEISQSTVITEDSMGRDHKTTIYNLTVLNRLGMCCFRKNRKAKEVRDKFNDVLVERETNPQPQSVMLPNFCNPAEAARAWADLYEKNQATELRALTAEAERDEAIRTKAQIGSDREATAMATASAKSRECKRLTAENAELKDAVGRGKDWHTVNMMTAEWKREFGHAPSWQKLMEFSADLPKEMKPVRDVEVKVVLQNGSEKVNKLFRYHREAWAKYREYEENRRATAESRRDASNEGISLNDTDTEIEYF